VSWIDADLSQGLDPAILPAQADALIHLAQSDSYRDFPAGAADVFRVNVEAPATLMRWAVDAKVSRAVFASTGTVYEPFTGAMREDSPVFPTGYYGASKLACETLTLAYQGTMAVCQLRVFFLYGPGQETMMIARLIESVRAGGTLTLPKNSDGLVFVPTYVDDTARVFRRACEEGWTGIYNVASPQVVSFKELLDAVGRAVGKTPVVQRIDAPEPQRIVPDLQKLGAREPLGEFLTIDQGLARTLA
jgi:nucleoside-diphosphate-sugar epimerase